MAERGTGQGREHGHRCRHPGSRVVILICAFIGCVRLALCLDLLSSALVLLGVVWTAVSLERSRRRLTKERNRLQRITNAAAKRSAPFGAAAAAAERERRQLSESGIDHSTLGDLLTLRQDLELAV